VHVLKEDIQHSDIPIPQLYKETNNRLKSKGLHFVTPIPTLNNIKTALYASRKKTHFKTPSEVAIPSKFEEDFLLSDYSDDNCRIILFCSSEKRNEIKNV
jgi:aspartate/glutamate racemase